MEGYDSLTKVFRDRGLPGVVEALDDIYKEHIAKKEQPLVDSYPPPIVPAPKEVTLG